MRTDTLPTSVATTSAKADQGRGLVTTVTALAGAFMLAAGVWGLVSPSSFADFANFSAGLHFVHDAGAFQLGIGAVLLLSLCWRDGLAVALAGFLVSNTAHAVNHAVDLDLGGHGWDPWALAALSLLTVVALGVRLRQLGWVVGDVAVATTLTLAPFVRQKTVLLTSYRRDGTPVGAPVSLAIEGDRGFVRSPGKGGKVGRIRNNPLVEVGPCTARGKPTGPTIHVRARRLSGAQAEHAARLLARKHPLLQGALVPLIHRTFRAKLGETAYFELIAVDVAAPH
jgi:PPOX class probable F420-dependent enzyme